MEKGNRDFVTRGCEVELVKQQIDVVEIVSLGRAARGSQRAKTSQTISVLVQFLNLLHDAG